MDSLCGGSHRLQEEVLCLTSSEIVGAPCNLGIVRLTSRMDIRLTCRGGYTDGGVLHHTAEAPHGMSLEVGEVDHEVVVGKVLAHDIVFQVFLVLNGDADVVELIHDVHGEDAVEAMVMNRLPMFLGILTGTAVCCAALHNRTVYLIHQIADECGFQVMGITTLTC